MAALTKSGARKAGEIVIFALRMLHFSRFAMLSGVAVAPAISSSSQPTGDRCDQCCASFGTYRTSVFGRCAFGQKDLAAPGRYCPLPVVAQMESKIRVGA
jgi:hypothetical protein